MQQIRGENVLTLKSQSQTRWSCGHVPSLALKNRLVSVLQTSLKIEEPTPKATAECNGLIASLCDFQFVLTLLTLEVILRGTDALSRFLQSVDMDVFLARKTANGMVSTLKVLKNDRDFLLLWALAEKLAE